MKPSRSVIACTAVTLFVLFGAFAGAPRAQAARSAQAPAPRAQQEPRGKRFEHWSTERRLQRGAFGRHVRRQALKRAIKHQVREALRVEFDRDHSGRLEPAERDAARAELRAKLQQLKQRHDADQNGRLDPQERGTLRGELRTLRKARVKARREQR
jgi:hypothetical protein